jgi:hypothetical protein
MANYTSIPRRFNKPTSNINHAYIDATLKDKQKTIDTNFGLMQQTVDATLGQDLIRESDRDYLKQKVKSVLNTLDSTDQIKFDSKKSRFTIQDSLNEASKDPRVLQQVANTKKIRQVQEFYKGREKKGDINQQNFQYAYQKSGINSYLSGESDDVADFKYSEYVDVDAKLDETARKLKSASPNEMVSIQDPISGKTVSKKVSMVTPEEMRNYLKVQLNANDLKQLEIDGSMMYGMDDSTAIAYRDTLIADSNKKYANEITTLENYKENGGKTPGEIEMIDSQIANLEQQKSSFERGLIGQNTAEKIGGQQLIQNKIDLFSNLYTKNGPESVKYDSDYLKRMRDANSSANVAHNSVGGSPDLSTITVATDLENGIDPYADSLKRIDNTLVENSNYMKKTFAGLNTEQKKLVTDTMENIKNDPEVMALYKGQPLSNEALQLETINRLGPNFFPPDVAQGLRSAISSTANIQNSTAKTTSEFSKAKAAEEQVYKQVFEDETNLTMVLPQGEVNIQQYLKDNGVTNLDTYKAFIGSGSEESKKLVATLALQSMSLTNDITTDDFSLSYGDENEAIKRDFKGEFLIGTTNRIDLNESEYRVMRQSAHDLTGESLDETYEIKKEGGNYRLSLKNPKTEFSKIISKTNTLYQSAKGKIELPFIDTDRTARNESAIADLYDEDSYRKFASERLTDLDNTVAGNNAIRIQGDQKYNIGPEYQEILKYSSNTTFDKKYPIDTYKMPDGRIYITQTVNDETAINNEEATAKAITRSGFIQANDVPKMTVFNSRIKMTEKEGTLQTLEGAAGKINKMNFIGNNREQVEGLNRLYNKGVPAEDMFRKMAASKTARDIIFNPTVNQYMPANHPIRVQFEDFVKNTQNYNLDFTKGIDSDYQVLINNQDGKEVGSIPINGDVSIEAFEKAYQGTPQVFLALYSQYEVKKYKDQLISNGRR